MQVRHLECEGGRVPKPDAAHHLQAGGVPAEPEREELHLQEVQVAEAGVRVGAGAPASGQNKPKCLVKIRKCGYQLGSRPWCGDCASRAAQAIASSHPCVSRTVL